MIDTQSFYGIPLQEVTADIIHDMDADSARELYVVASMLGWDARDKQVNDHYPYEAEEYLRKFRKHSENL